MHRELLLLVYGKRKTNNGHRKLAMVQSIGPYCARCKEWTEYNYLTVDHIIPRKMGLPAGHYQSPENRQLLCLDCQHMKCLLEHAFKNRVRSRKARYCLLV